MANDLIFSTQARKKITEGIKIVKNAVEVTLGPCGRNVIIEQDFGAPLIINDGVTIAKNIVLKDKYENLGASLLIEAARKSNDLVGDGTTTTILLASECVIRGVELVEKGVSPTLLREGLNYYLNIIQSLINQRSVQVSSLADLEQVASLSSGSKQIGTLIKNAYKEVGFDGEISVEEGKSLETTLEVVKGYSYDRGFASSYMANNEQKMLAELVNPYILVTDKKLTSMKEILPFLEASMKEGIPLLIVCDDIEQEVLSAIVMNKLRGVFNVVVTKAPSFGERKIQYLQDIAKVTKATFINSNACETLSDKDLSILGRASKVICTQNKCTIIGGSSDAEELIAYIETLKQRYEEERSSYEKNIIKTRIAKLLGGIALIKVGAYNEVELQEMKLRIEDALCATRAASVSGTIEGAGKTLFEIASIIEQDQTYPEALSIIKEVLKQPFMKIIENAGIKYEDICTKLDQEHWLDVATKSIVSLRERGIIDPTSVAISSISSAISIASIILTTECAIIKDDNIKNFHEEDLI